MYNINDLLDLKSTADLLNVNPETLRRWDRDGKLRAVKINSRGDRRYTWGDICKFLPVRNIIKYKDFEIIPYSHGFERLSDRLATAASYLVRKNSGISGFAFAVGPLALFGNPTLAERDLEVKAIEKIKFYIDQSMQVVGEEYTFEFEHNQFYENKNPIWWKKGSLKALRQY